MTTRKAVAGAIEQPVPESWPVHDRRAVTVAVPAQRFPPSRPLSRAAAALGVDARAPEAARRAGASARAQSLRLHRRRIAARRARRRRGDARRCVEEGDRLGQGEPGGLEARRRADPLDPRRRAQVRRARGPPRPHAITSSWSIRRSSAAGPTARSGTCSAICRALLRDCAELLAPGPRSASILTAYAIRASALMLDQLCREMLGGRGRPLRERRTRHPRAGRRPRRCRRPSSRAGAAMTSRSDRGAAAASRVITSLQNDRVKLIRSLEMRKARRDTGLFVAEGASVLMTARDERVAAAHPRLRRRKRATARHTAASSTGRCVQAPKCLEVSQRGARQARRQGQPADLLGVFEQRWADAAGRRSRLRDRRCGWRSRRSAIPATSAPSSAPPTRSARAASSSLATAAIPIQREAVRATHGLDLRRADRAHVERAAFVDWAAGWPGDVVGTHLDAHATISATALIARPTLLVMGREGPGLSDEVAAACTRLVKIPMAGKPRLAQPRRRDGADALRDQAVGVEAHISLSAWNGERVTPEACFQHDVRGGTCANVCVCGRPSS